MTTFYDLIKELAYHVGDMRQGVSTGGSTTTLVDTSLNEANEYYNKGTLLIDQATPAIVYVNTYASATTTFTFATLATAVAAGVGYTAIRSWFPLDVLKRSINLAILESELIMKHDDSITLVADQERYALPAGVTDVRRVEIGTENGDDWQVHYNWRVESGELRFTAWVPSDSTQTVRLHYTGRQAQLSALTDTLDEQVSRHRLMLAACKHALIWRNQKTKGDEPELAALLNYYLSEDAKAKNERVSPLLPRDPIYARY